MFWLWYPDSDCSRQRAQYKRRLCSFRLLNVSVLLAAVEEWRHSCLSVSGVHLHVCHGGTTHATSVYTMRVTNLRIPIPGDRDTLPRTRYLTLREGRGVARARSGATYAASRFGAATLSMSHCRVQDPAEVDQNGSCYHTRSQLD